MEIQEDNTIFENIRKTIFDDLEQSTGKIYNSLIENKESFCSSLPESIFVNYFLPCFIGVNASNQNWLLEWISIAGTPSSYVRIFKDNNFNETLFFVPPVLNTNFLNNGVSLKTIINTANDYSVNIPIVGTRFLYEALNDKSNTLLNQINDKNLQEWIEIFKRYNLVTQNENTSTAKNNLNDYLEI